MCNLIYWLVSWRLCLTWPHHIYLFIYLFMFLRIYFTQNNCLVRWCRTNPGNCGRKSLLFGSCLNALFPSIRRRNFHHSCKICQLSFDLAKKNESFSCFLLANFPFENKMRHRFTLELDFSRTAVQIATKTCPVHFQHKN